MINLEESGAATAEMPNILTEAPGAAVRVITTADEANAAHRRIVGSVQDAIAIGEFLSTKKAELESKKYGLWSKWVEDELEFGRTTAFKYIRRYEKREVVHDVNNLDAAYKLLAAPVKEEKPVKPTRPEPATPEVREVKITESIVATFDQDSQRWVHSEITKPPVPEPAPVTKPEPAKRSLSEAVRELVAEYGVETVAEELFPEKKRELHPHDAGIAWEQEGAMGVAMRFQAFVYEIKYDDPNCERAIRYMYQVLDTFKATIT